MIKKPIVTKGINLLINCFFKETKKLAINKRQKNINKNTGFFI